jgi:hypothetical protein
MAVAWKSDGAVTSVFVGAAVNLLMKRLHRVCSMEALVHRIIKHAE